MHYKNIINSLALALVSVTLVAGCGSGSDATTLAQQVANGLNTASSTSFWSTAGPAPAPLLAPTTIGASPSSLVIGEGEETLLLSYNLDGTGYFLFNGFDDEYDAGTLFSFNWSPLGTDGIQFDLIPPSMPEMMAGALPGLTPATAMEEGEHRYTVQVVDIEVLGDGGPVDITAMEEGDTAPLVSATIRIFDHDSEETLALTSKTALVDDEEEPEYEFPTIFSLDDSMPLTHAFISHLIVNNSNYADHEDDPTTWLGMMPKLGPLSFIGYGYPFVFFQDEVEGEIIRTGFFNYDGNAIPFTWYFTGPFSIGFDAILFGEGDVYGASFQLDDINGILYYYHFYAYLTLTEEGSDEPEYDQAPFSFYKTYCPILEPFCDE